MPESPREEYLTVYDAEAGRSSCSWTARSGRAGPDLDVAIKYRLLAEARAKYGR